jgi:hypothetical protein
MPTDEQIIESMAEYIAQLDCRDCPVYNQCRDEPNEQECKERIRNFFEN